MQTLTMRTYRILESILDKPLSKSTIARKIRTLFEGIRTQLMMLEDKGLITIEKKGRECVVSITKKGRTMHTQLNKFFNDDTHKNETIRN